MGCFIITILEISNTEFDELITENGEYEPDNAIDIIKLLLDVQKGRQQVRDEFLLKLSKTKMHRLLFKCYFSKQL